MHPSRLAPAFAASLLLALAACDDDQSAAVDSAAVGPPVDGGSLVWTVGGAPGTLFPPHVGLIGGKQITDLVYERLVEIEPSLNTLGSEDFAPRLARSWEWAPDSASITFHLAPEARWHDGRPVTSEDVRFTVALNQEPAVGSIDRAYLESIDSVTTPDSLTATFWFSRRYPEQFYDAAARLSILPSHVLRDVKPADLRFHTLASTPLGSGRFRFVRAVPGSLVELAANTGYHLGRPHLDRVVMTIAADPTTATTQFMTGDADVYEMLRLENMAEVAHSANVAAHVVPGTAYSFMAFNFRDPAALSRPHPVLAEPAMRRAIAMAVDRAALVESVLDSLGTVGAGPFPRSLPVADTTTRHPAYAVGRAQALLDSLGWRDADGDGVRERNGRPLVLSMIVPTSSALRQRLAVGLQQQLAPVGVTIEIRQMEFVAFQQMQEAGKFDLTLNSFVLADGSPAGLRNTWGTNGVQNAGRYSDPAFDAQVDSGNATFDAAERRAHFSRAFAVIAADVPALWLYEPRNVFGLNRRLVTPPLRPVGWWLDLHEWWIPADRRTPRDAAAPATVARQ